MCRLCFADPRLCMRLLQVHLTIKALWTSSVPLDKHVQPIHHCKNLHSELTIVCMLWTGVALWREALILQESSEESLMLCFRLKLSRKGPKGSTAVPLHVLLLSALLLLGRSRERCVSGPQITAIHQPHAPKCGRWYYEGGTIIHQIPIFCRRVVTNQRVKGHMWQDTCPFQQALSKVQTVILVVKVHSVCDMDLYCMWWMWLPAGQADARLW